MVERKFYRSLAIIELKKIVCNRCKRNLQNWDDETFKCWLKYIDGCDRKNLVFGTRFSSYGSLKYHFRGHPCYKKIAIFRKKWFRKILASIKSNPINYPWLLGLFYADGTLHMGSQLSFSLSKHERIIADSVVKQLNEILDRPHIVLENIGNMINVRSHSIELCDSFPKKNNKNKFESIWENYSNLQKMQFIAGFIDGDGSCSFEDDIDSIGVYSKQVPFLLENFHLFLSKFGYVSLKENKLYISPKVGTIIKKEALKRFIKKPYSGSVDTKKCYKFLKSGFSIRKIAKTMNFDKKTITIALRRVYGKNKIERYVRKHRKVKLVSQKMQ